MIRTLLCNREDRHKIAVIDGEKNILYDELIRKASALGQLLMGQPEENIAIFLPDSSDYIAVLFGVFRSGRTAFPLNCLMTAHEIIPLLKQASAHTVVTSRIFNSVFEDIQSDHRLGLRVVYLEELRPCEDKILSPKTDVSPDKPMVLLNTSGSTGTPAIVQLSEKNVETAVLGYLDKMNFKKKDGERIRYLLASPFTSAYGLMILSACLIQSFPVILLRDCFTLTSFYQAAQQHKATHYEGGASVLLMMEQTVGKTIPYDISLLNDFGFGGSKISGNTLRKLSAAFPHIRFWQGYGMTEAAPLITKYANMKAEKLDSVGTAIKDVKIAIDTAGGITKQPFAQGEIVVKGPNVMAGYYKNEEKTKTVLKNGYLYTGDIGYLDEEGYLYICGRKKSIIIVRGLNVHPEEVESCLMESLMVKDCIVYGEVDSSGNEWVCADIVPINPQIQRNEIIAYCSVHLSSYKMPQNIRMVTEIKKAASGKTERKGKGAKAADGFDTF